MRSGLRHILFARWEESQAVAIDEYLRSLEPVRSPHLTNGVLSRSALRGKRLFESRKVGCAECHPAPLFTDRKSHVLAPSRSQPMARTGAPGLDTPTLVECWRTAPYLHDGSSATVEEVLTMRNPGDRHGHTSHLSEGEIRDLCEYVLSL